MGTDKKPQRLPIFASLVTALLTNQLVISTGYAELQLTQSPLYSVNSSVPNILFVLDDSASMNFEILTQDLANDGGFSNDTNAVDDIKKISPETTLDNTNVPPAEHYDYKHRIDKYNPISGKDELDISDGSCSFDGGYYSLGTDPKKGYIVYTAIKGLPPIDDDGVSSLDERFFPPLWTKQEDKEQPEEDKEQPGGEVSTQYRCNFAAEQEWRIRDHRYNSLYYDPSKEYLPWYGENKNGTPFSDVETSITAAQLHPYDPDVGTINLLTESALITNYTENTRGYYDDDEWKEWCETTFGMEADKLGSASTRTECVGWRYYDSTTTIDNPVWVKDLSEAEQQNFANWFVYHRTRGYAAKYALSKVVEAATRANLGYSALNQNNFAAEIKYSSDSNKQAMLNKIFATHPHGGTPLRSALIHAGEYYRSGTPIPDSDFPTSDKPLRSSSCQINSSVIVTDGIYDNDYYQVEESDPIYTTPHPEYPLEDHDGSPTTAISIPSEESIRSRTDSTSTSLADIAAFYYDTNVGVEVNGTEEKMPLHMRTYAISFGPKGDLLPGDIDPKSSSWPDPFLNTPLTAGETVDEIATRLGKAKIDDLLHAATYSEGKFFNANNSLDLVDSLKEAINTITSTQGSAIQVSFSNYRLDDSSLSFSSTFSPTAWTSSLSAKLIDAEGLVTTEQWEAGELLTNRTIERQIITYDGTTNAGKAFSTSTGTNGLSDTAKQTILQIPSASWSDDKHTEEANKLIDFIRGDDSEPSFRERESLLGDIVNSSPIYVGPPGMFYPDYGLYGETGKRYSSFWQAHKTRTPMLYVGANDGMLHAFNATAGQSNSGQEIFAYIPESVHGTLKSLSLTDYHNNHRYYVDSTPIIADAYFRSKGEAERNWHTVVTGGLGAGGKGWYALNATNPSVLLHAETNANNIVLWEFNEGDDTSNASENSDIGYSFSKPIIAMTNIGTTAKRWAMITGNGYNSESGRAKLFIVFLDASPSADNWLEGTDYIEIDTTVGEPNDKNGLSSPNAIDLDGDGTVDRVYAGDLEGNMWAFDISSANAEEWDVAHTSHHGSRKNPLFQATNEADTPQPITVKPAIIRNPIGSGAPNLMVYFGTGQYIDINDTAATKDDAEEYQSFYAVWDNGRDELEPEDLVDQSLNEESGTTSEEIISSRSFVDARINTQGLTVSYGSGQHGWRVDLLPSSNANGTAQERVITDPRIQYGVVFFSTFTPSTDACNPGGSTWFMFLDAVHGSPPKVPIIDLNKDRLVDASDLVTSTDGTTLYNPGGLRIDGSAAPISFANEIIAVQTLTPDVRDNTIQTYTIIGSDGDKNRRVSWRELRAQE